MCLFNRLAHFVAFFTTTLLPNHFAHSIRACLRPLLRHHLAYLIRPYTLLWNHLAYFVTACLDSLLLNHFADFVTLLFDNGLSLIADTVNLLLTNFRNPYFFADCPGWALNLNLLHWPRTVTAFS